MAPMTGVGVFVGLFLLSGLAGWEVFRLLGLKDIEAWALGRVGGLVVCVFLPWWMGSFGFPWWAAVALIIMTMAGVAGARSAFRVRIFKTAGPAELVFWAFVLLMLFLRAPNPEILNTEKLMDMGILTSLVRTPAFPPQDFWLAHTVLPYYYWGALPWAFLIRASGIEIGIAYNLIVALLCGTTALVLWVLGRRLGGSELSGWMAAVMGIVAGTPDGLRQLIAGAGRTAVDLWPSSRQIPGAITEYPLFSFSLGDLHPHLLSMPPALLALALALIAAGMERRKMLRLLSAATLFFGVSWAANPWSMPPTLAGMALLLLFGDGRRPVGHGKIRWAAIPLLGAGGALSILPFLSGFHPPPHPLRAVYSWTRPIDFFLYAGIFLVPVAAACIHIVLDWGSDRRKSWMWIVLACGGAVILGVSAGRPLVPLLSLVIAVLAARIVDPGRFSERPALALALLGFFLFLVCELVFVQDCYGAELHRMNTIFKAYIQAWPMLAVAFPVMLRLGFPREGHRWAVLALIAVLCLPHVSFLAGESLTRWSSWGLDGLRWMDGRDRGIISELGDISSDHGLIEAVGDAYSSYGRISSASGLPAYLGWANHERVWRGSRIIAETTKRTRLVRELYSSTDPGEIRRLVLVSGVDIVVFGSLEAKDFGEEAVQNLVAAGDHAMKCPGGGTLVFFDGNIVQ